MKEVGVVGWIQDLHKGYCCVCETMKHMLSLQFKPNQVVLVHKPKEKCNPVTMLTHSINRQMLNSAFCIRF